MSYSNFFIYTRFKKKNHDCDVLEKKVNSDGKMLLFKVFNKIIYPTIFKINPMTASKS